MYIMILTQLMFFLRFLNFTYSFVEVNVDVSYEDNHNFSGVQNKSNPGRNGSDKNTILIFLFSTTNSFVHLLKKPRPDVRV